MILYDAYLVQQKKVQLNKKQLKRREEMNIEMTEKVKKILQTVDRTEKIQNECVLDAVEKGY